MKNLKVLSKRGLSLLIAGMMTASMMPMQAFASDGEPDPESVPSIEAPAQESTAQPTPEETNPSYYETELPAGPSDKNVLTDTQRDYLKNEVYVYLNVGVEDADPEAAKPEKPTDAKKPSTDLETAVENAKTELSTEDKPADFSNEYSVDKDGNLLDKEGNSIKPDKSDIVNPGEFTPKTEMPVVGDAPNLTEEETETIKSSPEFKFEYNGQVYTDVDAAKAAVDAELADAQSKLSEASSNIETARAEFTTKVSDAETAVENASKTLKVANDKKTDLDKSFAEELKKLNENKPSETRTQPVKSDYSDYTAYTDAVTAYNDWVKACSKYNTDLKAIQDRYTEKEAELSASVEAATTAYEDAKTALKDAEDAVAFLNGLVEDYDKMSIPESVGAYNDAISAYKEAITTYKSLVDEKGLSAYNEAVKKYEEARVKYEAEVSSYNTAAGNYNTAAGNYNSDVDKYNDKVDSYNKKAEAYNNDNATQNYNQKVDIYEEARENYENGFKEYLGDYKDYYNQVLNINSGENGVLGKNDQNTISELLTDSEGHTYTDLWDALQKGAFADITVTRDEKAAFDEFSTNGVTELGNLISSENLTNDQLKEYNNKIEAYNAVVDKYNKAVGVYNDLANVKNVREKVLEKDGRFDAQSTVHHDKTDINASEWYTVGKIDLGNIFGKRLDDIKTTYTKNDGNDFMSTDSGRDVYYWTITNGNWTVSTAKEGADLSGAYQTGKDVSDLSAALANSANLTYYEKAIDQKTANLKDLTCTWVLKVSDGANGYVNSQKDTYDQYGNKMKEKTTVHTWHLDGYLSVKKLSTLSTLEVMLPGKKDYNKEEHLEAKTANDIPDAEKLKDDLDDDRKSGLEEKDTINYTDVTDTNTGSLLPTDFPKDTQDGSDWTNNATLDPVGSITLNPLNANPMEDVTTIDPDDPDDPTDPDEPTTPSRDPNPVTTIDEEPTPLAAEPELTDIADVPAPLQAAPEEEPIVDLAEEEVPLAEAPEELVEIPGAEVPLADVPQTGDAFAMPLLLSVLFGCGVGVLSLRKKEEEI